MFITKESGKIDLSPIGVYEWKMKYKTTGSFAWQIGAGSFFGEHVSAGIHYQGYGKHSIKYTDGTTLPTWYTNMTNDDSDKKVQKRSIGLLSLRIGFHF